LVVFTIEKPVAPVSAPRVADVVLNPDGVLQTPAASVQYWNWIEPTEPVVGSVNWKKWLTTALILEPPLSIGSAPACSVRLREVIWAAEARPKGISDVATIATNSKAASENSFVLCSIFIFRFFIFD
jgi:hypothetical protein